MCSRRTRMTPRRKSDSHIRKRGLSESQPWKQSPGTCSVYSAPCGMLLQLLVRSNWPVMMRRRYFWENERPKAEWESDLIYIGQISAELKQGFAAATALNINADFGALSRWVCGKHVASPTHHLHIAIKALWLSWYRILRVSRSESQASAPLRAFEIEFR